MSKKDTLRVFSFALLFFLLFLAGFFVGRQGGYELLVLYFGEPYGEAILTFFLIDSFFAVTGGVFGLLIATIILHRLGRRWKVSVFRPTLFGFLTFLLLLFLYILYLGR